MFAVRSLGKVMNCPYAREAVLGQAQMMSYNDALYVDRSVLLFCGCYEGIRDMMFVRLGVEYRMGLNVRFLRRT